MAKKLDYRLETFTFETKLQTFNSKTNLLKFIIHWILLKFWVQTRKLQDKQDSKIDSINGPWYFNKTNVDGKWYVFRNICFVIFSWLSVVCCIIDCPTVLHTFQPLSSSKQEVCNKPCISWRCQNWFCQNFGF